MFINKIRNKVCQGFGCDYKAIMHKLLGVQKIVGAKNKL